MCGWITDSDSTIHLQEPGLWLHTFVYAFMHACVCVCECMHQKQCWKNASIKPQGMEGTPHLPPTEKVKLLNINSGSGHHADYTTITILHTASMDPLHPHTPTVHTLFTLPVLTRPSGIKTEPEREPCRRPMQTYINTFSHNRPQSRSFIMVLAQTHGPRGPLLPMLRHTVEIEVDMVEVWKCTRTHMHAHTHTLQQARTQYTIRPRRMLWVYIWDLT